MDFCLSVLWIFIDHKREDVNKVQQIPKKGF